MEETIGKYHKNFFGIKSKIIEKRIIKMENDECKIMVATKKCDSITMMCEGEFCNGEKEPDEVYSWMSTTVSTGYRCRVTPRTIVSPNEIRKLFVNQGGKDCSFSKLFCQLPETIVIWSKDLLKKCNYQFIEEVNLTSYEGDIVRS